MLMGFEIEKTPVKAEPVQEQQHVIQTTEYKNPRPLQEAGTDHELRLEKKLVDIIELTEKATKRPLLKEQFLSADPLPKEFEDIKEAILELLSAPGENYTDKILKARDHQGPEEMEKTLYMSVSKEINKLRDPSRYEMMLRELFSTAESRHPTISFRKYRSNTDRERIKLAKGAVRSIKKTTDYAKRDLIHLSKTNKFIKQDPEILKLYANNFLKDDNRSDK